MPEGPLDGLRLTNVGPFSRETVEEVERRWDSCPEHGKHKEICESIKYHAVDILEDQGVYPECETLMEINEGECFDIAERVLEDVGGVTVLKMGDYDHVWIEYEGTHYDAEVPSGVSSYDDLPIVSRIPKREMLEWAKMGARAEGREEPETFEDTVKDVTEEYA